MESTGPLDERLRSAALDESDPFAGSHWEAIARFRSGAEAGYFADELAREADIEGLIKAEDRFDGVHGMGTTDFVLMVAPQKAERASEVLRSLVAQSDMDEDAATRDEDGNDIPHADEGRPVRSGTVWVPIILTLAAGSIAYWGVHRDQRRVRPPGLVNRERRQGADLLRTIGLFEEPWVQKLDGATRELVFDREAQTATVREDRDGDGIFERTSAFELKR